MSLQRTMKRAIKRGDSTCTARESRVREGRPASANPGKMRKKVHAFMLKKQRLARFTTAILMRAARFTTAILTAARAPRRARSWKLVSMRSGDRGEAMTPEQYDLSVSKRFMKNGVEPELVFPTLGLCGEAGEVYTALLLGCSDEELMKELGDTTWYVAACAKKLGSSYAEVAAKASLGFAARTLSVQGDEKEAAALMAKACAFADMVKKAAWHGAEINKQVALNELERVLRGIYTLAHSNYMTMEEVLQANHDKLEKRYPTGFVEGGGVR